MGAEKNARPTVGRQRGAECATEGIHTISASTLPHAGTATSCDWTRAGRRRRTMIALYVAHELRRGGGGMPVDALLASVCADLNQPYDSVRGFLDWMFRMGLLDVTDGGEVTFHAV